VSATNGVLPPLLTGAPVKEHVRYGTYTLAQELGLLRKDLDWMELAGENAPTIRLLGKLGWPIGRFLAVDRDPGVVNRSRGMFGQLNDRIDWHEGDIVGLWRDKAPGAASVVAGRRLRQSVIVYDTQSTPQTVLPTLPALWERASLRAAAVALGEAPGPRATLVVLAVSLRAVSNADKERFKQHVNHQLTEHSPNMWLEYRGHDKATRMLVIRLHFHEAGVKGLPLTEYDQMVALKQKGNKGRKGKEPSPLHKAILEMLEGKAMSRADIQGAFPDWAGGSLTATLASMKTHGHILGDPSGYYLPGQKTPVQDTVAQSPYNWPAQLLDLLGVQGSDPTCDEEPLVKLPWAIETEARRFRLGRYGSSRFGFTLADGRKLILHAERRRKSRSGGGKIIFPGKISILAWIEGRWRTSRTLARWEYTSSPKDLTPLVQGLASNSAPEGTELKTTLEEAKIALREVLKTHHTPEDASTDNREPEGLPPEVLEDALRAASEQLEVDHAGEMAALRDKYEAKLDRYRTVLAKVRQLAHRHPEMTGRAALDILDTLMEEN
jgi:hypothetical protein